jgi:hypothetical protein
MVQELSMDESGGQISKVQSLQEIKKSRRTVILGSGIPLHVATDGVPEPLTPPLSERASDDVAELFSPETEEHFESVDLSSEDEVEWNQSQQEITTPIQDPEQVEIAGKCFTDTRNPS